VRVDPEPAGSHCPHGGSAVKTGVDRDGDGVLDDSEIDATEYVCSALVRLADEPAGANCARGGTAVLSGPDATGHSAMAADEATATAYVCKDAAIGPLTRFDPEPVGGNCPAGGTAVKTGLDLDGNGTLSDSEATSVRYLCKDAQLTRVDK